jgi:uncharacterized protein (TIGR02145 family)
LTITSGSGTNNITITGVTAGTYNAGTIKVKANNDCGPSAEASSTSAVTVASAGAGPTVTGSRGSYRTYCYPDNIGCWTIDNSKEGTYDEDTYDGQVAGSRGYYYVWSRVATACPSGYSVPTEAQWTLLKDYINGSAATSTEKSHWLDASQLAGYWDYNSVRQCLLWGSRGIWWSSSASYQYFQSKTSDIEGSRTANKLSAFSVRCIRNE